MKGEPLQTIIKFIPLAITIGTVAIALINALIFIRTNADRERLGKIEGQHQVMANEVQEHEKANDTQYQVLSGDIRDIKNDVRDIRQFLLGK